MNIILKSLKRNYKTITIIISGLCIGILAISMGLSFVQDAYEFSREMEDGSSKESKTLIYSTEGTDVRSNVEALEKIALELSDKYSVTIGSVTYPLDRSLSLSDAPSIRPIIYAGDNIWKPNLLYGRYMTKQESLNSKNVAVIGYEIYKKVFSGKSFSEDMVMNIYGQDYKIIGVVGRERRYCPQNYYIDIPYKNYEYLFEEEPDIKNIPIFINGEEEFNVNEYNFLNIRVVEKPKYINDIKVPVKLIIIVGLLILLVTTINESNLFSFWIFNRKKEIAIKKALGATNRIIILEVVAQTLILSIISIILAITMQYFICIYMNKVLVNYELHITYINFIIALILAVVISLITTLVPSKIIICTNATRELKK